MHFGRWKQETVGESEEPGKDAEKETDESASQTLRRGKL